jgi:hypothetical protein
VLGLISWSLYFDISHAEAVDFAGSVLVLRDDDPEASLPLTFTTASSDIFEA